MLNELLLSLKEKEEALLDLEDDHQRKSKMLLHVCKFDINSERILCLN